MWSGDEQANFQAVLDKFAADTGATVKFTSTGDDIATVLGTRVEGKNPPDVAMPFGPAWPSPAGIHV